MSNAPAPRIIDVMKCTKPTIIEGGLAVDDRGELSFVNNLAHFEIKRFYQVHNHQQGFVRAWHGHREESKLVYVTQGSAVVQILHMDIMRDWKLHNQKFPIVEYIKTHILSVLKPTILFIPKNHFNGFKTLTQNTNVMFFSNRTLFESKADDVRIDWDAVGNKVWDIEQR